MNTKEVIKISNLAFSYAEDPVIHNLNFSVRKGELVLITGENGSGKSTLLKLILGEYKPVAGSIHLMGTEVGTQTDFSSIGYVPQSQTVTRMGFPITCLELVVLNLSQDFGWIKIPRAAHKRRGLEMLKRLGLEEYWNTPMKELSGGLRQRVMIARALINNPSLLILDEPTSGIDQGKKVHFLGLIQKLNQELHIPIILVTHELGFIQENLKFNKIYRMENGGLNHVAI